MKDKTKASVKKIKHALAVGKSDTSGMSASKRLNFDIKDHKPSQSESAAKPSMCMDVPFDAAAHK